MTSSLGQPLTIRQSRRKIALACLGAAGFVALGIWFISAPEQASSSRASPQEVLVVGWLCILFFSACLISGLAVLARPATISFDRSGMTVTTIWKSYKRPWSALSNFQIWSIRSTKFIVFDDTEPASGRWWAGVNSAIRGTNSSLPAMLDGQPEKILEELQAAKAAWG